MPKEVQLAVGIPHRLFNSTFENSIDSDLKILHFHNLEELPFDEDIDTPEFWCFEQKWKLRLHISRPQQIKMCIGLFLVHCPSPNKYYCRGEFCLVVAPYREGVPIVYNEEFEVNNDDNDYLFGSTDVGDCMDILSNERAFLNWGTLEVRLEMRLFEHNRIINLHGHEYQLRRSMCNALSDADTSDISFDVKGQKIMRAHLVILKAMTPDFVRTLNLEEHGSSNPVPISDVEPEIFQLMLEFIYGGTVTFPEQSAAEHAKAIIDASDKYGVDSLKLAAEESYVDSIEFTVDNVVETLLYADGKNCMKLKEKAMEYLMRNMAEVVASPTFANLYQSEALTKEILVCTAKHVSKRPRR